MRKKVRNEGNIYHLLTFCAGHYEGKPETLLQLDMLSLGTILCCISGGEYGFDESDLEVRLISCHRSIST